MLRNGKLKSPVEDNPKGIYERRRCFINKPIGEKEVTALSGVGTLVGYRFRKAGNAKAYAVMGQFLVMNKDQALFMNWMKDTVGCTKRQARDCCECLQEWCDNFL